MLQAHTWFLILFAVVIVGPYVCGVRPRTPRDWRLISIAVAFIAWMLLSMVGLRAA